MGRGRDGHRLDRRVVTRLLDPVHQPGEAGAVDAAQVQHRAAVVVDGAGDDVARGELVGEPLAVFVEQQRAGAAKRLAQKERRAHEGGGVELGELHVRDRGPRLYATAMPPPTALAGFVVRTHRPAAPPVVRIVARPATGPASVSTPKHSPSTVHRPRTRRPA